MMSYMWRKGAQPVSLILLLVAVICARAAPVEEQQLEEQDITTTETMLELQMEQQQQQQRIDCKLTFDATMDSLEQQQLQHNGCNVPQASSSTSSGTNKPADANHENLTTANVLRHSMSALSSSSSSSSSSQPLYELQLVVWPSDIEEDGNDLLPASPATSTTPSLTSTTTTTTMSPSMLPLYEDQLVVFPQMDFEEENFDYFFDELQPAVAGSSTQLASSTTTPKPRPTPTTIEPQPTTEPIYVVENYRIKHANGTEEHKLVLSNGLVNYMKLYVKLVGDRVINVQEGYNSVPMAGNNSQIQTLHYIADERGYNVYKIEYSPWPRVLPTRGPSKATKSAKSKPDI